MIVTNPQNISHQFNAFSERTWIGLACSLTHSRSWALLEKLPIVQPFENFSAFYGTWRFITVSTTTDTTHHQQECWYIAVVSAYPLIFPNLQMNWNNLTHFCYYNCKKNGLIIFITFTSSAVSTLFLNHNSPWKLLPFLYYGMMLEGNKWKIIWMNASK
jgi:hypothetical protein